jgi:hypothetical protein
VELFASIERPLKARVILHCWSQPAVERTVRGVQRLKKAPHDGQFMHEMSGEEEDNASFFEEEFNRWLSDDPLDNGEIYKLVSFVEDQRKKMGEPPLVQFLKPKNRRKKTSYSNKP